MQQLCKLLRLRRHIGFVGYLLCAKTEPTKNYSFLLETSLQPQLLKVLRYRYRSFIV